MQASPLSKSCFRYKDILELINIYQADTKTCLKELEQLVHTSSQANVTNRFLPEVRKNCFMRVELTQETLATYTKRKEDDKKKAEDPKTRKEFMPIRFNAKYKSCNREISNMQNSLEAIAYIIEQDLDGSDAPATYENRVLPPLRSNISLFSYSSPRVAVCLQEYQAVLHNTTEWLDKVYDLTDELLTDSIFTAKTYNFTVESEAVESSMKDVENLYIRYAYGTISKLEYLEHFKGDDASSAVLTRIDNFMERIKSRVTDPLRQRIHRIRKELERSFFFADRKINAKKRFLINNIFIFIFKVLLQRHV